MTKSDKGVKLGKLLLLRVKRKPRNDDGIWVITSLNWFPRDLLERNSVKRQLNSEVGRIIRWALNTEADHIRISVGIHINEPSRCWFGISGYSEARWRKSLAEEQERETRQARGSEHHA